MTLTFAIRRLLLLSLLAMLIVGCNKAKNDPYKSYRQYTSEQLFERGEKQLSKRHYVDASRKFEALNALYPFGPNSEQANLDLMYAYYKNNDEASTIAAADRYVRLYPRGANVDYAYYLKGVVSYEQGLPWVERRVGVDPALRDLGNKEQAFAAFNELVEYYPHSVYAADALARLNYIRDLEARKNVIIAEYYLKRKAYVAAANRASDVIEHFNGSRQVIPALAIQSEAYHGLGLTQLADRSFQVLQLSYPDSPELKKLMHERKYY
jgi:outer membrane protein assembly factor BamD